MLVLTVTVPSIAVEKSKPLDDNSGKALFPYSKQSECNGAILQFYFDEETKQICLRNIGNESAHNITISIEIEGPFLLRAGAGFIVVVGVLEPDQSMGIGLRFVFGIGPIRIIYTASAINADSTSITLKGFIIGFFIFGLRI